MMSSFSEKSVAAAGTETQASLAHKPMHLGYGTAGGPDNGASALHATTVYQPEGVVLTNPANPIVVTNDQNIGDAACDVYEPVVCQPEGVATEVMNATAVVSALAASGAAVQAEAAADLAAPEAVNASLVNNGNNISKKVVMNDQNNGNDSNNVNGSVVVKDDNKKSNNEVVTPNVVSNLNSNGSIEVVTVFNNVNNSKGGNEVVTPSVVSNINSNGSNEVVVGSNEVVTPSVVNYQNNGIGNNAVAINSGVGEAIKRKRGRPRRYPIGEASAVPVCSPSMQSGGLALVNAQVQGSSEKRGRGRPAGSGKKHKADATFPFTVSPAISGSTGSGFLPYIITVRSGEYVQPKLLSLSQVDKQVVCVLSASGTISNVTLQQPLSSGGTVTYQGRFEILSLSGSFLLSESGGRRSITGGLSVSLAVPNGCIFGGGVAGPLIADSDVQIIVGTFLASEQNLTRPGSNNVLIAPPTHVSTVGGSPPSRALLSESSGASRSPFNHINGGCNNGNQQPVPNVAWM